MKLLIDDSSPQFTQIYNVDMDSIIGTCGREAMTVYLMMRRVANRKTGQCNPSISTIAGKLRMGVSTVRKSIAQLETAGFVRTETQFDKKGRQTANQYTLLTQVSVRPIETDSPPYQIEYPGRVSDQIDELDEEKEPEESNDSTRTIDDEFAIESDRKATPYEYWEAFCEGTGMDPSQLTGTFLSKQLAVAKRMASGMTVDDMTNLATWIVSDPWWRTKGVDLFIAEKQFSKWVQAGKPASHIAVTGREKRISGSTPRG
jgi:hypothetical protein